MESLFDIFGERAVAQVITPKPKNLSRLQLGNENIGKVFSSGSYAAPTKPNNPIKRLDNKKSFLVNKGTALQSTPLKPGTPFGKTLNHINKKPMKIYSDLPEQKKIEPHSDFEIELEFHKPCVKYDNYERDMFDDMAMFSYPEPQSEENIPRTPEPVLKVERPELNYTYGEEIFNEDFSNESFTAVDLDLSSYY